jgi:hypothetical protein
VTSRDLTPFGSVAVCLERQSLFAAVVGRHTAGVAFAERTVSGGRLSGREKGVIKQTGVATRGAFIQTMYKKGRRYLVAPEPFGDGVRDLEECSGRGSEESAARTYCCSGRTWTLLALRSFRSDLDAAASSCSGRRERKVKGTGMAGVPSQWEGTGQEDGEAGKPGFPRNGRERARKKREGRGSLAMGGNGPGKRRKRKAGVPSQWEGTGQEKAGRLGFPRNGRERARKAEKAGKPGFPRNGRERARRKREGRGSLAVGGNGPGKRRKRESRGSLAMGGNGPGKRRKRVVGRVGSGVGVSAGARLGAGRGPGSELSSAGSARSFYCHGGTARGPRLAAGAVGELGSARSPGAVGRKKHGFRSGFGRRGSCSWFRANFLHRLGERAEFFRHRERFLVTSLQFFIRMYHWGRFFTDVIMVYMLKTYKEPSKIPWIISLM